MEDWLFLIVVLVFLVFVIFLAIILGIWMAKLKKLLFERKLVRDAKQVIEGNKKNQYQNLDGKMVDANRFKLKGDNGKDIVIELTNPILKKNKEDKEENVGKKQRKGFIKNLLKK